MQYSGASTDVQCNVLKEDRDSCDGMEVVVNIMCLREQTSGVS